MTDIVKAKFRYVIIIVIGMMLMGMQTVYGEELRPDPADVAYDETFGPQFTLGDTDKDFVYTPVKPCRIFDTRKAGGSIGSGGTRAFYVYGDGGAMAGQGGNPAGCPAARGEPRAVHINIAVDDPIASGYLTVWPTGTARPTSAVLNYKPTYSDPISNAFTVITGFDIGRDINVYAYKQTHVIADVMGYYYEVDLDELYFQEVEHYSPIAAGTTGEYTATCPAGSKVVGGGWHSRRNSAPHYHDRSINDYSNYPSSDREWRVGIYNNSGEFHWITVYAICMELQ